MKKLLFSLFVLGLSWAVHAANTDKTLVSWIELKEKTVTGGSALTIQDGERFDGIIYSEKNGGTWIPGSEDPNRSQNIVVKGHLPQNYPGRMVQMAAVYKEHEILIFRNFELYARYKAENVDLLSGKNNFVVFGLSHWGGEGFISGEIEDARIYDRALTVDDLRELQPNVRSDIEPWAWWDFEGEKIVERTGRFTWHNTEDASGLKGGRLVLGEWGKVIATRGYVPVTPGWPQNPPGNWLTYHLAHPGPGVAEPGDPNPAFYYKDRYHLHYIYADMYGIHYAHVSSKDMVHWKWHPTVLAQPFTGHGMFSGTGFFTKEGKPAMIYHGEGSGRNWLAFALDQNMDKWSKPLKIEPEMENGKMPGINHWDPDCWRMGDTYYALSGGKDPELMKSDDLVNLQYLGKLLHENYPDNLGVSRDEDISCANMFKIGNKWILLCISHHLGCRYFLGDFKDEKYLPEFHAKMNWINTDWENGHPGLVYFAPESMIAADGRRVMWAWLMTELSPTGIQSLPRELELPDDGLLRIKPLRELESLRYDGKTMENITVKREGEYKLTDITGDAVELHVTFGAPLPKEFGINLLTDEKNQNGLRITAGADRKTISIGSINPPFETDKDKDLTLRIFIDKNLVEVFADDRQAAAVAFDHIRESSNIGIFTKNKDVLVKEIKSWKMKSIYE